MQDFLTNTETNNEEITRPEAARLLGVTSPTMKRFPIPFRQYVPRGNCYYRKADVLRFKEESMNRPTLGNPR